MPRPWHTDQSVREDLMKNFAKAIAGSAVAASAFVSATVAQTVGERYVLVTHAPDSDGWWNTIKNAMALACE